MYQNSADSLRTASLWQHMGGLFGADALERKFGRDIPREWTSIVERMPAAELERGMRRLVHSGKAHVPTLPEFVRLCKAVGDDGEWGGPKGQHALPAPAQNVTDPWGTQGNIHFFAYVYGHAKDFAGLTAEQNDVRTRILVRWKNEWAQLMRDGDAEDHDPVAQKAMWEACMTQAEAEMASAGDQVAA